MGKRKPDPDLQRALFKNVPSDLMYLFRYMAESDIDRQNDQIGTFEKMSKQEQEQVLTDYFAKIVREHATARMGKNLVISHITSYHIGQRILKDKIEAKKISAIDPQFSK